MYNYLVASAIHDDFYLDDLILEVGKPEMAVEIRGYPERLENQFLKELPKGE